MGATTQSADDTRRFIGEGQRLWAERRSCRCGIVESRCLVGVIDLHDFTEDSRSASIGYWLAASAQGRGCSPGRWGRRSSWFLGYDLQRLVIRCSTENLRSQRAAERQGFRRDGGSGQRDHRRACPRPCDLHAVAQRMARCASLEWPGERPGVSAAARSGSSLLA
ncbi:GNAT family protein [Pseudomonas aeruginosa]|nr:GNAT family protein [Pseudomonas aeruginosa]